MDVIFQNGLSPKHEQNILQLLPACYLKPAPLFIHWLDKKKNIYPFKMMYI